VTRGLLVRKKLTKAQVRELHEKKRINPDTFKLLQSEGLV
jgi:hypothetical protein